VKKAGRGTVLQQMIEMVKQAQGFARPGGAAGGRGERLFHGGRIARRR